MTNRFHIPVSPKRLIRASQIVLIGLGLHGLSADAQSATAPPVAIPYTITTVAGSGSSGSGGNGGPATQAALSGDLRAVDVDGQGNLYIADTSNNEIRKVNVKTGIITVVAGGGTACTSGIDKSGDGCPAATGTVLNAPRGVALDKAGNIYIADYGAKLVHRVDAVTGIMTLAAGELSGVTGTCTKAYSCASGTSGYSGDGGPATQAALDQPRGVRVDNFGNIWIADTSNNVVREVNAQTGIITTVVGSKSNSSASGFAGDGSLANSSAVLLNEPIDIVFDSQNNAYITDFNNHRIREVNAGTGIIQTIAGNGGTAATTAPAWPQSATNTAFGSLTKEAIDRYGNLYFTDTSLSLVFFYDAAAGTVTPIAGEYGYAGSASGFPVCAGATDTLGDGCPATQALFYQGSSALGVAIDGQNSVYVTDPADYRIRKISTNLSFPAIATGASGTESQAIDLHFTVGDAPKTGGIAIGAGRGEFAITSAPACTLNSDNTTNCIVPVSFTPTYPGLQATPLLVASNLSHRSLPLSGVGQAAFTGLDPGTASTLGSSLSASQGEAFDAAGNLYVADTGNNRVVEINASTQAQTTIAGTGSAGYTGDNGPAASATLSAPRAVAVGPGGFIYIADTGNNVVRVIDPVTGNISTFAGGAATVCVMAYDAQGDFCPATQASLHAPSGLAVDTFGNLYIADTGNNLVRRVDAATGYINLDAGLATPLSTGTANTVCPGATDAIGDGCLPIQAALSGPRGLALDASGDLYIADTGNNRVRMIELGADTISTLAGNGQAVFSGDGGAAALASLNAPQSVAVDAAGNVYIADTGNEAVRTVTLNSGIISTLFGAGGTVGSSGGSGLVSALLLSSPGGVAIAASGNLYVSDTGNNRVLEDNRNQAGIDFGTNNDVGQTSAEQTVSVTNLGNAPLTFTDTPAYVSSDLTDFTFDTSAANACAGSSTLSAGQNCTLGIAFAPLGANPYTASVTFPSNAANQATAAVALSGTGKILIPTSLNLAITSPANGKISYGQSGTITATVTPTSGSGTPTGTITFTVGGTQQPAVSLANGSATLTLSVPPVGGLTIIATYSGDLTYAAGNSTLTVQVAQDTTTTTLTSSATSQTSAQPTITFTATVASNTGTVPTGTVNFYAGTTLINPTPINLTAGKATATYSAPSGTGYSATAVYAGNVDFGTSTSTQLPISIPADFLPSISLTQCSPSSTTSCLVSVPQGGSVQISSVSVAPQGGISGSMTLSCTGLPANTTCTFFPTSLTLGGTSPSLTTALTITTNVQPLVLQSRLDTARPGKSAPLMLGAALFPTLLFAFGGWAGFRRRSWLKSLVVLAGVAALGSILAFSGCTSNATQEAPAITPVGTSTVQIVFTGPNNVSHSVPITLTVIAGTTSDLVTPQPGPGSLQLARVQPQEALSFVRR